MSENDTLLAHLAPRIAGGPENAAVEALAYILNQSESTAAAFNDLVSGAAGLPVERCTVFRTQVTAEDNSRPDLVGFDGGREKRVIGEAKFWAPLRDGQARDYLNQLSPSGPSMLLFVVPESRADRLWVQIKEDVSDSGTWEDLDLKHAFGGVKGAECVENDRRVGMVSWLALIDRLFGMFKERILRSRKTYANCRALPTVWIRKKFCHSGKRSWARQSRGASWTWPVSSVTLLTADGTMNGSRRGVQCGGEPRMTTAQDGTSGSLAQRGHRGSASATTCGQRETARKLPCGCS